MTQYMLAENFLFACIIPFCTSALGYYYGYRYATTGREVSRKPYLVLLCLYTGLFAIPPMTRVLWLNFHALMFAYECGRLLVFRGVWLQQRTEAYLHVLVYFIIVCSCMAHNRADFTLFILLPVYVLALVAVLFSLYIDNVNRPGWSFSLGHLGWIFPAIFSASIALSILLPASKLWDFELVPQTGKYRLLSSSSSEDNANATMKFFAYLEQQKLTANPDSPLGKWLQEKIISIQKYSIFSIHISLEFLVKIACYVVLLVIIFWIWRQRHKLWMAFRVYLIDALIVAMLSDKKQISRNDAMTIYRAYERFWSYNGIEREKGQSPFEHWQVINASANKLADVSRQMVSAYQPIRYGNYQYDPAALFCCYVALRSTIQLDMNFLFKRAIITKAHALLAASQQ